MTAGERIKQLRIKAGMSQVELAIKMDVSKQTLYKYENNIITNIPSDKIEIAANLFNVPPSYLMGWDDNLNKDAAILTVDLLSDQDAMNAMKKILELSKEDKKTIYDMVDFLHQKEES